MKMEWELPKLTRYWNAIAQATASLKHMHVAHAALAYVAKGRTHAENNFSPKPTHFEAPEALSIRYTLTKNNYTNHGASEFI